MYKERRGVGGWISEMYLFNNNIYCSIGFDIML